MEGESSQKNKTVSISDLLRRNDIQRRNVSSNTRDSAPDEISNIEDSDDNSSQASEEMDQMVVEIFNEVENHLVEVENQLPPVGQPVLYPELAPIMWELERVLNSKKEVNDFLQKENFWSFRSDFKLKSGLKTLYRCDKVTRKGEDCAAEIFILRKLLIDDNDLNLNDNPNDQNQEDVINQMAVIPHPEQQNEADQISGNPHPEQQNELQNEGDQVVVNPHPEQQNEPQNEGDQMVANPIEEIPLFGRYVYEVRRKNREHNHDELENKKKTMKKEVEDLIIELYGNNNKPQTIIFKLRDMENIADEDQPSIREVRNAIDKFKKKSYGADPITMKQLTDFVNQNMKIPDNIDQAFILSFERSPPNEKHKYFRFFITTRRLLQIAAKAKNIHADATYKVTAEKLPLLVVGSTDMKKTFHLIGLVISSHETTAAYEFIFKSLRIGIQKIDQTEIEPNHLISDADPAIHAGFKLVFDPSIRIIMCFPHVMGNVQRKYAFNDQNNKESIKQDLRVLHLAPNDRSHQQGCELFVQKWQNVEEEAVRKIQRSFFKKNKNWFTGAAPRVPKDNNSLEQFNGSMKIFQTQFEKKPLKQFQTV